MSQLDLLLDLQGWPQARVPKSHREKFGRIKGSAALSSIQSAG
jgi:hypothetical protein